MCLRRNIQVNHYALNDKGAPVSVTPSSHSIEGAKSHLLKQELCMPCLFQYNAVTFVLLQMIPCHLIQVPYLQAIMLAEDRCLDAGPQHKTIIPVKEPAPLTLM